MLIFFSILVAGIYVCSALLVHSTRTWQHPSAPGSSIFQLLLSLVALFRPRIHVKDRCRHRPKSQSPTPSSKTIV